MGDDSTRFIVRLLISVLIAAAMVLITVIATGSPLDETGGKAIATAVTVALCSLAGAMGTNLVRRQPGLALFGYLTAAVALVAFVSVTLAIWADGAQDGNWRVAAAASILAIGSGHASLLLASARAEDSDAVRLTRAGVLLAIALLCPMAIVEISSPGPDVGVRPIAVLAVLYLLGTVLLPLLRRSGSPRRYDAASR